MCMVCILACVLLHMCGGIEKFVCSCRGNLLTLGVFLDCSLHSLDGARSFTDLEITKLFGLVW